MKKRLLAIILTICLLGTVIIDNVGLLSNVEASDESTTETSMPTSSHTFKDFGVTEGTYKTENKGNQFNAASIAEQDNKPGKEQKHVSWRHH